MFEYFNTIIKCNKSNKHINSIDSAILYNDEENNQYHYIFKNIHHKLGTYIVYSKCRIQEDTLNTIGDHIKVEPKYPIKVSNLNWKGLYFTTNYEEPTHISTLFLVKTKYVLQYLKKQVEDEYIIIAIQDNKVIFCTKNERLVDSPIDISDIWTNITDVSAGIMITKKDKDNLYLFYNNMYSKIINPFFGRYNNNKFEPLKIDSKVKLKKSKIWDFDMKTGCYNIDAIVPIYNPKIDIDIKYYIFQEKYYIRYNILENKTDTIISDITLATYYLIYGKLIDDLKNTSKEVNNDYIVNNASLIDKNIYNIEAIIKQLCKKKIKLYKLTKDKKFLSVILKKTIGINETLIFKYSNKVDSNKVDYESTFTYKDSNNIKLDISSNFQINSILYVEKYPQLIGDNFPILWKGTGNENENIHESLEKLYNNSNNLLIDAATFLNNKFVFFKNYNNKIKYLESSYNSKYNDFIITNPNYYNYLKDITMLFKNEKSTIDNGNGKLIDIDAICLKSKQNNSYYIFGKILNSPITRVVEYFATSGEISLYAETVSNKFPLILNFLDIITVFNLDPYNKLNNTEPTLCFILNTEKNNSLVITTNPHINKCRNDTTGNCLISDKTNRTEIDKILIFYINFINLQNHKKMHSIINNNNLLFIIKNNKCFIYHDLYLEESDLLFIEVDIKDQFNEFFYGKNIY